MSKTPMAAEAVFAAQDLQAQISEVINVAVDENGWIFYANEEQLTPEQVAGQKCMLPAILWHSVKLHRLALPHSHIDIEFVRDGDAYLGARALLRLDDLQSSPSGSVSIARPTILMTCMHALRQALKHHPSNDGASLDHLVDEFFNDHENKLIPWSPGSKPAEPDLSWMRREVG